MVITAAAPGAGTFAQRLTAVTSATFVLAAREYLQVLDGSMQVHSRRHRTHQTLPRTMPRSSTTSTFYLRASLCRNLSWVTGYAMALARRTTLAARAIPAPQLQSSGTCRLSTSGLATTRTACSNIAAHSIDAVAALSRQRVRAMSSQAPSSPCTPASWSPQPSPSMAHTRGTRALPRLMASSHRSRCRTSTWSTIKCGQSQLASALAWRWTTS
mmetsp:Transcript_26305/g.43657  ORF Transcript_26305/g.43657 Transcript_26305/m.43657 type:complete len:214 (+) Transcript_26305:117-758(+)